MSSICELIISKAALVFFSRNAANRQVLPYLSTLLKPTARFFLDGCKNDRLWDSSSPKMEFNWSSTVLALALSHIRYSILFSPFSKMCAAVSKQYSSSLTNSIGSNLLLLPDLVLTLSSSSLLSSSALVSSSLLRSPSYDLRGSKLRISS